MIFKRQINPHYNIWYFETRYFVLSKESVVLVQLSRLGKVVRCRACPELISRLMQLRLSSLTDDLL